MKKYTVSIIGLGFVGLTLAAYLAEKNVKVLAIDKDVNRIKSINKGITPFFEPNLEKFLLKNKDNLKLFSKIDQNSTNADFIFITVGTPAKKNGGINLEFLMEVISELKNVIKTKNRCQDIVIKSTVTPTTATNVVKPFLEKNFLKEGIDYNILSNPEFLREGLAIHDTINPHLIVIGGEDKSARSRLKKFYKEIYLKDQNFIETDNSTAELIKYANNAFLATKISFINSISNICQKIPGANVDDVAKAIGFDSRIGKLFLQAGPGYGGSCFPKDVQALIQFSKEIGYEPELFNSVKEINDIQIDIILEIIKSELKSLKEKKIGVLGLSFKENTDDIRESISIKFIKKLNKQTEIFATDPKAIENTKKILKNVTFCKKTSDVIKNADCVILFTPWEEYKKLTTSDFLKMKNKLVVDTRRILKIDKNKIKYIAIGVGN